MVQVTAHFRVNLSKNVCSFRKVELVGIKSGDTLAGLAVLLHQFFVHRIVCFFAQQNDHHFGVAELFSSCHVKNKLFLDSSHIVFSFSFDKVRVLDC